MIYFLENDISQFFLSAFGIFPFGIFSLQKRRNRISFWLDALLFISAVIYLAFKFASGRGTASRTGDEDIQFLLGLYYPRGYLSCHRLAPLPFLFEINPILFLWPASCGLSRGILSGHRETNLLSVLPLFWSAFPEFFCWPDFRRSHSGRQEQSGLSRAD